MACIIIRKYQTSFEIMLQNRKQNDQRKKSYTICQNTTTYELRKYVITRENASCTNTTVRCHIRRGTPVDIVREPGRNLEEYQMERGLMGTGLFQIPRNWRAQ